jgi:rubrerythrin
MSLASLVSFWKAKLQHEEPIKRSASGHTRSRAQEWECQHCEQVFTTKPNQCPKCRKSSFKSARRLS